MDGSKYSDRRRVLQVHRGLGRDGVIGGSSRVAVNLTRCMSSCTLYDADLCLLGSEDPFWSTYGLPRRPYAFDQPANYRNPVGQSRSILRLRKLIRAYAPHIVHSHTWPVAMIAGFALCGLPAAHVIHIHDMRPWLASTAFRQRIRKIIYRWAFRCSRASYIACADAVRQYAVQHLLPRGSVIKTLHSGIDLSRFESDPVKSADEGKDKALVLGMSGAFQPMKGHEYLLKAMASLRSRGINLQLICTGWGSLESQYKQMAEDLGLKPFITFMGRVREMKDFYRLIDICVLPSLSEGLSLSLLEAMAMGKPVIATRVGGTAEAVRDGENGLLIEPANADSLATAIERLATNPELRAAMGKHGRKLVEEEFRMENMARRAAEIYDELLRNHPTR